ncbi:hypothetical protein ST27_11375 [Xanthomonas phaseoli pv. phaseoli]|nr:hypothetical protein ST27_11375 [Xanthomonas phaseoli pv. phaseoli]
MASVLIEELDDLRISLRRLLLAQLSFLLFQLPNFFCQFFFSSGKGTQRHGCHSGLFQSVD